MIVHFALKPKKNPVNHRLVNFFYDGTYHKTSEITYMHIGSSLFIYFSFKYAVAIQ
jgi:hypothetical protein